MAGYILYANPVLRSSRDVIRQGMAPAHRLWPQGISGDLPIVLVRIATEEELGLVRELLRAFEYWRLKGVAVDLVILNERAASYVQDLQGAIESLVRSTSRRRSWGSRRRARSLPCAPISQSGDARGVAGRGACRAVGPPRRPCGSVGAHPDPAGLDSARRRQPAVDDDARRPALAALSALRYFNGTGGFSPNGREYVTVLGPGADTPAPWINVISGPEFGFQVAADGAGYTWARNSRDNQLTPWSNDPVTDRPGEIVYVRDIDRWHPVDADRAPIRVDGSHLHGASWLGIYRFEVVAHGIAVELLQYRAIDRSPSRYRGWSSVTSAAARRLSVTGYTEWVLGLSRGASAPTVVTEQRAATGAIFARNPWNMITAGVWPSPIWAAARRHGPPIAASSSAAIAPSTNPAALSGAVPLSGASAPGSILARPCKRKSISSGWHEGSHLLSRPGRRRRRGAGPGRALPRRRSRRRLREVIGLLGRRRWARCR